jgi:hypothetical protein
MEEETAQEPTPIVEPPAPQEPEAPESFGLFSDEPSELAQVTPENPARQEVAEEKPKSKQFLDNLKRDREVRAQAIALKQKAQVLNDKERALQGLHNAKEQLENDPEEFLRSQGIDPQEYYRNWTERLIGDPGQSEVKKELNQLKASLARKDQQQQHAQANAHREAAFSGLCKQVEQYAVRSEGYPVIKETCTAKDIVNGMVTHYQQTGQEISIEEAFEKIETGLRERESSFYKDPKIIQKLQRYNPEAFKTARGPQATLSSRFQEQPTRTDPSDMSHDEIKDMFKGKLFT